MKHTVILIIVFVILALSVINAVNDQEEFHTHQDFFQQMTNFANKGGRFTAQDGQDLCEEINKIKFNYNDMDLVNCDKYSGQQKSIINE